METDIKTLQQENEKLNSRLKKAIQVFSDQKENIERLTAESAELQEIIKTKTSRIEELENKLKEKEQDDNKFFDQLQEIDKLNDIIKNNENTISQEKANAEKLSEAIESYAAELHDCEQKLIACENKNKSLQSDLQESKAANQKLTASIKKIGTNFSEWVTKMKVCVTAIESQAHRINEDFDKNNVMDV